MDHVASLSVPLLTRHFPVSSHCIYIHCLRLQENLFNFNHHILIYLSLKTNGVNFGKFS